MNEAIRKIVQPEWSVLNDAIDTWLVGVLSENIYRQVVLDGTIPIPEDVAAILNKEFSSACRFPEFSIKGVRIADKTAAQTGPIEIIPSEYFRVSRAFRPHLNSIESYSDDQSMKEFSQSRQGGERNPDWVDVVVHSKQFMEWLARWVTGYLVTEISNGKLTPDVANARLKRLNFEGLHEEPKTEDFIAEVSKEIYWTLPMTVAWISTRSMTIVTTQHENFDKKTGHWISSPPGALWVDSEGPSLLKLMLAEAVQSDDEGVQKGWVLTIKQAREELWRKLQSGELEGIGSSRFGSPEVIPSFKWLGLQVDHGRQGRDWVRPTNSLLEADKISDVRFLASKVKEVWAADASKLPEVVVNLGDSGEVVASEATQRVMSGVLGRKIIGKPTKADHDKLSSAYKLRVTSWPESEAPPSLKQDQAFLGTNRDVARNIRSKHAPESWTSGGLPKKYYAEKNR